MTVETIQTTLIAAMLFSVILIVLFAITSTHTEEKFKRKLAAILICIAIFLGSFVTSAILLSKSSPPKAQPPAATQTQLVDQL